MIAYKTNEIDHTLKFLATDLNIERLEFKRQFNDLRWLYKLMNYNIECPEVLYPISLKSLNSH